MEKHKTKEKAHDKNPKKVIKLDNFPLSLK